MKASILEKKIEKWIIMNDILFKDIWTCWYIEFSNEGAIFGKQDRKENV